MFNSITDLVHFTLAETWQKSYVKSIADVLYTLYLQEVIELVVSQMQWTLALAILSL